MKSLQVLALGSCLGGVACAANPAVQVPAPQAAHEQLPSSPHVSWMVATRDKDRVNDNPVCDSVVRGQCEIRINSSSGPQLADFDLYLHPSDQETTYTGHMTVGFLGDSEPSTVRINQVVAPAQRSASPIMVSTSGLVKRGSGTYEVTLNIDAISPDRTVVPIRDKVLVAVKDGAAGSN